jgi:hypothetical protein
VLGGALAHIIDVTTSLLCLEGQHRWSWDLSVISGLEIRWAWVMRVKDIALTVSSTAQSGNTDVTDLRVSYLRWPIMYMEPLSSPLLNSLAHGQLEDRSCVGIPRHFCQARFNIPTRARTKGP